MRSAMLVVLGLALFAVLLADAVCFSSEMENGDPARMTLALLGGMASLISCCTVVSKVWLETTYGPKMRATVIVCSLLGLLLTPAALTIYQPNSKQLVLIGGQPTNKAIFFALPTSVDQIPKRWHLKEWCYPELTTKDNIQLVGDFDIEVDVEVRGQIQNTTLKELQGEAEQMLVKSLQGKVSEYNAGQLNNGLVLKLSGATIADATGPRFAYFGVVQLRKMIPIVAL